MINETYMNSSIIIKSDMQVYSELALIWIIYMGFMILALIGMKYYYTIKLEEWKDELGISDENE